MCVRPNAKENEKFWRFRIKECICMLCNKPFNKCTCENAFTVEERKKMTPLAIQLRAKLRKDKRMKMTLTCGVCGNLLDNVSDYLIQHIKSGHTSMGKCTQCKQKDHETKKKCNRCQVFHTQQHFTPHNWQHQATHERICNKQPRMAKGYNK